jgi:hypothetical protein
MTRRNPGVEADTTTQWARVLTEEEAAAELTRLQEEAEPWRARCRRLEGERDDD